jgi:murein DD-endopeptidase MepM/ murein hydrolase activator NlpD
MTWMRPLEGKISASFQSHKDRTPTSKNPGTDYAVAVGTPAKAIADGVVSGIVTTIAGAGGRMVFIDFPSGHKADYLHLSRIDVVKGQAVKKGDVIGLTGGSGLGKELGYGPHLHLSFRVGGKPTMATGNIDFEAFLAEADSAPVEAAAPVVAEPAPVTPKPAPPIAPVSTGRTYKVVSGDNLTKIANKFRTTVPKLVALNGIKNPNLIFAGQVLRID